jgi:hypothetical protein
MALTFTKDANTMSFDGRSLPVYDPTTVNVVTAYSDGRQMYAYDKGIAEQTFTLDITQATQTEADNIATWHETIAVGPLNTFTFTDEDSTAHTVRLMNLQNPLKEVSNGRYAGTITLRKEI